MAAEYRKEVVNQKDQKIQIRLSCENLEWVSETDKYFLTISLKDGPNTQQIGATEPVESADGSPVFRRSIEQLPYFFHKQQELQLEIFRNNVSLGHSEVTLGNLVHEPGMKLHRKVHKDGESVKVNDDNSVVILRAERLVGASQDLVKIDLAATSLPKTDFYGHCDPYLKIYYKDHENKDVEVYKTEHKTSEADPDWEHFEVTMGKLCGGDEHRLLFFKVWDYDANSAHDFVGQMESSLYDMQHIRKKPLSHEDFSGNRGFVIIKKCVIERKFTWLDYLQGGALDMHMMLAFDLSNTALFPEYPTVVKNLGQVLAGYDSDNLYPVYGFGASVDGNPNELFRIASVTGNDKCEGVDGICEALSSFTQSGHSIQPSQTNFEPIFQEARRHTQNSEAGKDYNILMIFTTKNPADIHKCVKTIAEMSHSPLSIVIVGVGHGNFDQIKNELDTSAEWKQKNNRDLVQFVNYYKHYSDPEGLAHDALAEIPDQMVDYMRMNNIDPLPPPAENTKKNQLERQPSHFPHELSQTQQPPPSQPVQNQYQPPPQQNPHQSPQQNAYQPPPQQNAHQPPPQQNTYQPPPQQNPYQSPPQQNTYQQPAAPSHNYPNYGTQKYAPQNNYGQQPVQHAYGQHPAHAQKPAAYGQQATYAQQPAHSQYAQPQNQKYPQTYVKNYGNANLSQNPYQAPSIPAQQQMYGQNNGGAALPSIGRNLPPGWEEKWDANTQRRYYVNHSTRTTQWTLPYTRNM